MRFLWFDIYKAYPPQKILQTVSEESFMTLKFQTLSGIFRKATQCVANLGVQLSDPKVLKSEIEHEKQRLLEMEIIE